MQEITCPRCGALYFPDAETRLCPHCSWGPPTFFTKLRSQARRFAWSFAWLALIVVSLNPPAWAWAFAGFLAALAALGWAWSIFSQRLHRGAYERLNTIELSPRHRVDGPPAVPRPPPPPREWETLVSSGRPREVYWPRLAKMGVLGEAAMNLAFVAAIFFLADRRGWAFVRRHSLEPSELAFLIPIGLWIYFLPGRIRQELAARELLREGEATIGFVATEVSREQPYRVAYQFWTRTGERFERTGILSPGYDDSERNDRVPIFYRPEDPTKSIALCCTTSRVRLPGEGFALRRYVVDERAVIDAED